MSAIAWRSFRQCLSGLPSLFSNRLKCRREFGLAVGFLVCRHERQSDMTLSKGKPAAPYCGSRGDDVPRPRIGGGTCTTGKLGLRMMPGEAFVFPWPRIA